MKFRYTILYVDSVAATLDFYCRAFGVEQKMIHESGDYGELSTGDTSLSFSSKSLMTQLGKNPGSVDSSAPIFEIAFETGDVPAALKRAVDAGAKLVQDAETMPWGQVTSYVHDIDGFLVEICTPVSAPS
ncbi:MAG: VOC family protein [Rubripirellula sp.]